jgi:hypothetical protein
MDAISQAIDLLNHLCRYPRDDRPYGNLATRCNHGTSGNHGMITDRAGAENNRIGANPDTLPDRNISTRFRNIRDAGLEAGLVVMGAGNDRDIVASKGVVANGDGAGGEIEQGIHHFTAG